ncbi:MAG TPA: DUF2849 domain-containing protein [Gammaproteobacteria bacterium]|nr:DUF2849 domain-containing protein [Gammaproteobacteria bacterium]
MVIANRLADGRVVFLAAGGRWVTAIGEGLVLEADFDRALEAAKQHETECRVVEPCLIEVAVENGRARPVSIREAIRAFGPTVRTDLEAHGSRTSVGG